MRDLRGVSGKPAGTLSRHSPCSDFDASISMQAAQAAGKWLVEKFIVHGLVAAVSLPMTLLSVSSLIDSQWTVVRSRSLHI